MKKLVVLTMSLLSVAALSGCNQAKSPESVSSDVASAKQKASTEVANAKESAAKDTNSAAAKVDDTNNKLDSVSAKGAYDVAMAKADGDHKVASEQCLIMAGDAQKACKEQADAKYDLAKANAKAAMAAQKAP